MPISHWNGLVLPAVGDDLLASWTRLADSAGVVVPVASVAAARAVLTRIEADGAAPTANHPAYFDISGNLYKADGSKTDGVWALHAMGEPDVDEVTYTGTWENTLGAGAYSGMMISALESRPYDRWVLVTAGIYGAVLSGNVDLCVQVQGRMRLSRLDTGDAQSVSLTVQGKIPAGSAPSITAGVRGGSPSGGRARLSADSRFNYLTAMAVPISMA